MKIANVDERIHVLDNTSTVNTVIEEIADTGMQEEAFYICDVGDIVRKHQHFLAAMPRVNPFYAVKCNDSRIVLEVLAAMGTGFDCASRVEIDKVLALGVDPSRIIFANPAKPASHIRHAATTGVDVLTFDNRCELYKMEKLFPNARLVIRIRCDATVSQCPLGMKFGCHPTEEAPGLLELARDLNLEVIGVSFHVGSGCGEPAVFRRAIAAARVLFDQAESLGFRFRVLDIGGGYPGDRGTSISRIASIVNAALDDYFPDTNAVNVIAEPGRFYVSSAYTLACNVHSIRTVNPKLKDGNTVDSTHYMYYINDGVYGSFNCLLYDHQRVTAFPLKKITEGEALFHSSVWGPTCDGLDQVIEDALLPELQLGDWLVFENMGAYTLPVASPFNGFPIPKVHVVAEQEIWELLKHMLPLTEAHFVLGNTPANLRMGLDIAGSESWTLPQFPLRLSLHAGSLAMNKTNNSNSNSGNAGNGGNAGNDITTAELALRCGNADDGGGVGGGANDGMLGYVNH